MLRVTSYPAITTQYYNGIKCSVTERSGRLCALILNDPSEVIQLCPILCDPWTVAYQVPLSMGFSRQECWSGLPFPSPGDIPNPGIKPRSPALQADALPSEPLATFSVFCHFPPAVTSCHFFLSPSTHHTPYSLLQPHRLPA